MNNPAMSPLRFAGFVASSVFGYLNQAVLSPIKETIASTFSSRPRKHKEVARYFIHMKVLDILSRELLQYVLEEMHQRPAITTQVITTDALLERFPSGSTTIADIFEMLRFLEEDGACDRLPALEGVHNGGALFYLPTDDETSMGLQDRFAAGVLELKGRIHRLEAMDLKSAQARDAREKRLDAMRFLLEKFDSAYNDVLAVHSMGGATSVLAAHLPELEAVLKAKEDLIEMMAVQDRIASASAQQIVAEVASADSDGSVEAEDTAEPEPEDATEGSAAAAASAAAAREDVPEDVMEALQALEIVRDSSDAVPSSSGSSSTSVSATATAAAAAAAV